MDSPEGSAPAGGGRGFRIDLLENHQGVPVYHLSYPAPLAYDQSLHEEEEKALAALPDPRFALIVDCENLSHCSLSPAYREAHPSSASREIRERLVAVARYNPDSLTSMIRTMAIQVYSRSRLSSGFALDRESALRRVRAEIERVV